MSVQHASWIAVDWGSSNLRAWSLSDAGQVLDHVSVDEGVNNLADDGTYSDAPTANDRRSNRSLETALLRHLDHWLAPGRVTRVVICGMAGSRQGWQETAYNAVPCAPAGLPQRVPSTDPRIDVFICTGLRQTDPPDVMRGEETQIAGLLARIPDFEGSVCLPGTHSKWANVVAGQVIEFHTYMTGELFELLTRYSVLRLSLKGGDFDQESFRAAVLRSAETPAGVLSQQLFTLRARALLNNDEPGALRAQLSGQLIGHELAGAAAFWSNRPVAIVGDSMLVQLYEMAFAALEKDVIICSSSELTLAGLSAIHNQLSGET